MILNRLKKIWSSIGFCKSKTPSHRDGNEVSCDKIRAKIDEVKREEEQIKSPSIEFQQIGLVEQEARKKDEEKQNLYGLCLSEEQKKENWQEFQEVLIRNGITCLYHFTDSRNVASIKEYGGLFSWEACEKNNIKIPFQGGDENSRKLDQRYKLGDYVRLSFCEDHPMAYCVKNRNGGCELVVLEVKVDVAYLKDTLFSDMNATDSGHSHGGDIDNLKKVNFEATKMKYLRNGDSLFKMHQAEVMVKTFVPIEYIVNIDKV
ncbi:MAG: DUF4433 domain-containing protein [Porphyromonas endodontalis]|uniref:DUF4433 domain-containing protein n=1 Tax=Porphyromonas endodontalis TaxID=28124 RepID=UPI003607785A